MRPERKVKTTAVSHGTIEKHKKEPIDPLKWQIKQIYLRKNYSSYHCIQYSLCKKVQWPRFQAENKQLKTNKVKGEECSK